MGGDWGEESGFLLFLCVKYKIDAAIFNVQLAVLLFNNEGASETFWEDTDK